MSAPRRASAIQHFLADYRPIIGDEDQAGDEHAGSHLPPPVAPAGTYSGRRRALRAAKARRLPGSSAS